MKQMEFYISQTNNSLFSDVLNSTNYNSSRNKMEVNRSNTPSNDIKHTWCNKRLQKVSNEFDDKENGILYFTD